MYGEPTFTVLHNFHKILKDNATTVSTKLTNGSYGLLKLIISPTDWETLYATNGLHPMNLAPLPS